METGKKIVGISPIQIETVEVTIKGKTPLIVHSWDEKAKRLMLETQTKGKVTAKRHAKIPTNDFMASLYWLTDKPAWGDTEEEAQENWAEALKKGPSFGFPTTGIKKSVISGAYRAGLDVKQTELRGTFYLYGVGGCSTDDFAEISFSEIEMREDMVRVGGQSKSADIRYRAQFPEWEIPLALNYHKNGKYSLKQILNMFNYGGFCVGIGEWRPERNGQFGMYEIKTS